MDKHFSDFNFELKSLDADGTFAGYGSVFNVTDYGNDIVAPGAFTKTLAEIANDNRKLPILWQHDPCCPLGVYTTLKEDTKGLYVEGKLLIGQVQMATEAYALMKSGAVTGLSIGYSTTKSSMDEDTGIRTLLELDLWEVSPVTFPMNDAAQIQQVKRMISDGELPSLSEFEACLRGIGFTRKHATAIASRGLKGLLQSESAAHDSQSDSELAAAFIQSFSKGLQHETGRS